MDALLRSLQLFAARPWGSALEIVLLATVFYQAHRYFRGTRGARVLAGLTLFVVAFALLGQVFQLPVIRSLVTWWATSLPVILVVLFQPELRRSLADLGSRALLTRRKQEARSLDALCDCLFVLASRHVGALVAIERGIGLRTYAETGVAIDATFSPELLQTIFHPKTALHDGGVILRDERIVAAACIFPVTQRESLDRSFGLRHRAGLGLAEETDAAAIVVSEETGSVSLCFDHAVDRGLTRPELRRRLGKILLEGGGMRVLPSARSSRTEDEQDFENA